MQAVTITQITPSELDSLIKQAVQSALNNSKPTPVETTPNPFRYTPITEIFKRGICSKPTFYEHLKKGEFTLYKFGSKSFVDMGEFEKAFIKAKMK